MMTPPSHFRQLGELMCTVTEQVLWSPSHNKLVCRVGSGQATYHRFDPGSRQHRITYGARMIEAKHRPETARGWLSSREIQQRGYFDGQLSPLNLLAHTCCHEFAHLLQHNAGKRFRGSVHNPHFYRILDELHNNGSAGRTRQALAEGARAQTLYLPEQPFPAETNAPVLAQWETGECVRFNAGRRELEGRIVRVNRKTCTIDGLGVSKGVRYRVPLQLLKRA